MAKSNHRAQQQTTPRTAEQFLKELAAFLDEVTLVTTPEEKSGKRQRFPGFELTPDIKGKLHACATSVHDKGLAVAFTNLDDVRRHFQCKQAAYAKGLVKDLDGQIQWMERSRYFQGLIDQVRIATNAYATAVTGYFELNKASELYWAAIDKTLWADSEHKDRTQKQFGVVAMNRKEQQEADEKLKQQQRETAKVASDQRKAELLEAERAENAKTAETAASLVAAL